VTNSHEAPTFHETIRTPPIMHQALRDALATSELVAWHASLDLDAYTETYTVPGLPESAIMDTLRIKGVRVTLHPMPT
jgi:hypothetical protein